MATVDHCFNPIQFNSIFIHRTLFVQSALLTPNSQLNLHPCSLHPLAFVCSHVRKHLNIRITRIVRLSTAEPERKHYLMEPFAPGGCTLPPARRQVLTQVGGRTKHHCHKATVWTSHLTKGERTPSQCHSSQKQPPPVL